MVSERNLFPQRIKGSPRCDRAEARGAEYPDLEPVLSLQAKGAMEGCSARM